jgi:hypothetical protein
METAKRPNRRRQRTDNRTRWPHGMGLDEKLGAASTGSLDDIERTLRVLLMPTPGGPPVQ